MYCRYNYFYDRKRKTIVNRAGEMIRERKAEPNRYIELGSWYAHENQPYISGDRIVRDRYDTQELLLNL